MITGRSQSMTNRDTDLPISMPNGCKLRRKSPQNTQFFEKPKLNFYHRKMQRSLLFQNIYMAFRKMDLLQKLGSTIMSFEKLSRFVKNFSVVERLPFWLHQYWRKYFRC